MKKYDKIKDNPVKFQRLTGFTTEEFLALLPIFTKHFLAIVSTKTLDGQERKKRRYVTYKNSRLSNMKDKLLFILIYLRHAWTQDAHGMFFDMSQPETNKWIHLLSPILEQALDELGELPSREATPETFEKKTDVESGTPAPEHYFQDCTERQIPRPTDQQAQKDYYSGKKKQHTVKNNLFINAACKILVLSPTCKGSMHDKRIADETVSFLPSGSYLYQDSGFLGFNPPETTVVQPKKKPKGGELTAAEKARNREISSIRIRIEHVISSVKRYRIVKDKLRHWKKGFSDLVMKICCGLHNFRLNFRPWCYDKHFD